MLSSCAKVATVIPFPLFVFSFLWRTSVQKCIVILSTRWINDYTFTVTVQLTVSLYWTLVTAVCDVITVILRPFTA